MYSSKYKQNKQLKIRQRASKQKVKNMENVGIINRILVENLE